MTDRIDIGPGLPVEPSRPGDVGKGAGAPGKSFKEFLADSIKQVNDMQVDADHAIDRLATGRTDNVAEVFAAVQKAELAFKTLMQIRNKLVDAYNEIRQMRI